MKHNPFKNINTNANEKESPADPLAVADLLTSQTKKARITSSGELQIEPLDEKPAVNLMKERYWGAHEKLVNKRLSLETRMMQESFPQFTLNKSDKDFIIQRWLIAKKGQLFWLGTLQTYSQKKYLVACVYPEDYPFSDIRSFVLQPHIPATEHRFKDGSLCLYEHGGKGKGADMQTTVITIIAWTSAWLHAYEIWQKIGKWPMLGDTP